MFSNKSSYKAYLSFPLRATLYEFVRAKSLVRQAAEAKYYRKLNQIHT